MRKAGVEMDRAVPPGSSHRLVRACHAVGAAVAFGALSVQGDTGVIAVMATRNRLERTLLRRLLARELCFYALMLVVYFTVRFRHLPVWKHVAFAANLTYELVPRTPRAQILTSMPVIRDFDRFYDVERAARELVVGKDVLDTNQVKFVDVSDTKVRRSGGLPGNLGNTFFFATGMLAVAAFFRPQAVVARLRAYERYELLHRRQRPDLPAAHAAAAATWRRAGRAMGSACAVVVQPIFDERHPTRAGAASLARLELRAARAVRPVTTCHHPPMQ